MITGKTLGKLPWKRKVPLQRNGMAAIPKIGKKKKEREMKNEIANKPGSTSNVSKV